MGRTSLQHLRTFAILPACVITNVALRQTSSVTRAYRLCTMHYTTSMSLHQATSINALFYG